MLIREPLLDPLATKEIKVLIPARLHIQLHSLKLLTGKPISEAVTEALCAYFVDE